MEEYDVIFLDDDKTTVLDIQKVGHGEKAEYKGKTPTKEPTEKERYIFSGWENEERLDCVTEKLVLVAKYSVEVNVATKNDFYDASLANAEQANLAAVVESGKKIERPLLGISMINAEAKSVLKSYYNIDLDESISSGVVVIEISEGTGASKSSLKKGDVITKIDGKNVDNLAYLKYLLYKHNIGDTIELTYYRNGSYNTTKVNLMKNNQ